MNINAKLLYLHHCRMLLIYYAQYASIGPYRYGTFHMHMGYHVCMGQLLLLLEYDIMHVFN